MLDRGLDVAAAVAGAARALRGRDRLRRAGDRRSAALEAAGRTVARFRDLNLFFGGCQAVARDPAPAASPGAGDPRRGGVAVVA